MKLLEKADSFLIGAKIRVDSFLNHEEGDTNFYINSGTSWYRTGTCRRISWIQGSGSCLG